MGGGVGAEGEVPPRGRGMSYGLHSGLVRLGCAWALWLEGPHPKTCRGAASTSAGSAQAPLLWGVGLCVINHRRPCGVLFHLRVGRENELEADCFFSGLFPQSSRKRETCHHGQQTSERNYNPMGHQRPSIWGGQPARGQRGGSGGTGG